MSVLIGSTGFVGRHLLDGFHFDLAVHRSNVEEIKGEETEFLICAGLPAEKWKVNLNPELDFSNMSDLAEILTTVRSKKAVLISTVDVYQPAVNVLENNRPSLNGISAYGRHRAWFEIFFQSNFPDSIVIRLPGLFAPDVRKNLIHDLLNKKTDQFKNINKHSRYQFFNLLEIREIVNFGLENNISLLNVASEPVVAQEIANLFDVEFGTTAPEVTYDMRSNYANEFNGEKGYLYSKERIIEQISELKTTQKII